MSIREQIFAQACLLTGELEEKQRNLLELLCDGAAAALAARLREGLEPQNCQVEFIAAASLLALSALNGASSVGQVEEFRAGDLTVKQGSGDAASQCLKHQAEMIIGPYLADCFHFQGV